VSRKPRSSRLPPKLPDPALEHPPRAASRPTLRDVLKQEHVAGRSLRFGRDEVTGTMRRVERGERAVLFGLAPFTGLAFEHVTAAVEAVYGWEGDGPRARIAPARTVDGFTAAVARVLEVARGGRRLAFATARPASLLPLYRRLAARSAAEGGEVLVADESAAIGVGGRRVRWVDQVAVLTDGAALLADATVDAAEEWLFTLARPDLVVADHTYAGVASAAGLEVVAFADLDAVALAVAGWQGRALRLVPLDDRRPPGAYAALLDLLESLASAPVDPFAPLDAPARTGS
jgi:histidinol phosphate phosphatase hisN-like protein